MQGCRFAKSIHLFGRIIAHPDAANLSCLLKFEQRFRRLRYRNTRVRPMHLINIDIVGSEPFQRVIDFLANPFLCRVTDNLIIPPFQTDFGCNDNFISIAVSSNGLPYNFFRPAESVDGSRVNQIDPFVQCSMDGANRLSFVAPAPHPTANGPSAQTNA